MNLLRWIVGSKRNLLVVSVLILLAGGGWVVSIAKTGSHAGWTEVKKGDLVLGVEVTGTLRAVDSSPLGPPVIDDMWDYKIAMMAPEGKKVRHGEPVLGFDATELERKLEEKSAEAESAKKQIEKKRTDMEMARRQETMRLAEAEARLRKSELKLDVPAELASETELWKARLELEEAKKEIAFIREKQEAAGRADAIELRSLENQRDGAELRVRRIREAIDSMTCKAPRDGTVVYVSNWRDEKKKVGDPTWRGEKIVEIPDLSRMAAKGEVDEADAGRVAQGQRVRFRLDAHPDVEFTGSVSSIWSTVQRQSWRNPLKVMRLDINLDKTDVDRMRPGMRFRGTIESERVQNVLVIPAEAVFSTPRGPVAYRKSFVGFEAVDLELGRRDAVGVEVLSGLAAGDRVSRRDLAAQESREGA